MKDYILYTIDLSLFGAGDVVNATGGYVNTNTGVNTTFPDSNGNTLSEEMKTYYSDYLIDLAEPELVHDQFAQKHPIPKNGGKTIQFRKYAPLSTDVNARRLTEGVTPEGQKLSMTIVDATVAQYGGYVELTDMLLLTAIDNNLLQATRLLASQAGRVLDAITREELASCGIVQFAAGAVTARTALDDANKDHYLTVAAVKKAVRTLKRANAPKINGSFIAIVHTDVAHDLMNDEEWKLPHQYVDTDAIYEGEIGKVAGVRFVESTEAKVFHAPDLAANARTLKVSAAASSTSEVSFTGGSVAAGELVGRAVLIGDKKYYVSANTTTGMTLCTDNTKATAASVTAAKDEVIYPGEAGACGADVYATFVLGADAYGTTEITGGGLEHIVKQLGSSGAADPLNQRATAGWKASKVSKVLVDDYMVRIETAASPI